MSVEIKKFEMCPRCGSISPSGFDEVQKESRRLDAKICASCYLNERKAAWCKLCPKAFTDTEQAKLPNQDASGKVLGWTYGPIGLMLFGPTRAGKSRTAWMLCNDLFITGKDVLAPSSMMLGLQLPALMGSDLFEAFELVDSWCHVPVLLLDDSFKVKLTERIEQVIFTVIDERTQNSRPIIVTTNDTETSLLSRLSADRGPALLGRLNEFCECIQF